MISDAVRLLAPHLSNETADAWTRAFVAAMTDYEINAPRRKAALLGQVSVETGGFIELVENMNYSAVRICEVWPNRFPTMMSAYPYARNPEKLGNNVYANRMGNGDEASGDGFRFRGVGGMQSTGRETHEAMGKAMGKTPSECAAWCATIEGAARSACWEWDRMSCNELADGWQLTLLSRRINGGDTAIVDRIIACNQAMSVI